MALTPQKCILEQNSQIQTPPKVWVCGSPYVGGNEKLVSAIMKNQKNGSNAPKMHPRAKLPNIRPPLKFGSAVLRMLTEMKNLCQAIMKNQKNGSNAPKMHPRAKLPITDPSKVWVCSCPYVDGNEKLVLAIMKNQKNGSNTPKMHPRAKLPLTNTPKVWVCGSPYVDGNAKLVSAIMKNQKNGSNAPKIHPRAKLPIIRPPLKFGSAVLRMLAEMKNWCRPL